MRVAALYRHPVKSMGGETVHTVVVTARGVVGDRQWAVHDVERATIASARRLPALLLCSARTLPDGSVVVTLPDGGEVAVDDPAVHGAVSSAVDREVRLVGLPEAGRGVRLPWRERLTGFTPQALARDFGVEPGERMPRLGSLGVRTLATLSRYATPPGTFVDVSPVHVLTTSSLAALGRRLDGAGADVRRFRPNVLLDGAAEGLPEHGWTGGTLHLGAVRVRVATPTVRCVVPSRAQPGVPLDRRVTRELADLADRFLGVYCEVERTGTVRVGDTATTTPGAPQGRASRVAGRVVDGAVGLAGRAVR